MLTQSASRVDPAGRRRSGVPGRLLLLTFGLLSCAVIGSFLGWCALGLYPLTPPTGPFHVGTRFLDFPGTNAGRRQIQVWYPAAESTGPRASYRQWHDITLKTFYQVFYLTNSRVDAPVEAQGSPFPVIVFDHRWQGEKSQNTVLVEDLASRGYVVLAVDHPEDRNLILSDDGPVMRGTEEAVSKMPLDQQVANGMGLWDRTLDVWAADDRTMLDSFTAQIANPADALHGRVDMNNVGAVGHSFGGATALRLCGLDHRVRAAVNMDGWTFGALEKRTAQQSILIVYEGAGMLRRDLLKDVVRTASIGDAFDRADNAIVDASLKQSGGIRMFVNGTQHMDFTDQPLLPPLRLHPSTGPIAPRRIESIMRTYIGDFFDQSLRVKVSQRLAAQGTDPEVTLEIFPAPHP